MSGAWSERVVAVAALLFVASLQVHRLDDPDTWWHLASGRYIATHGTLPAGDPFSFTAEGSPWLNRQWLYDLGLYGLWETGGPSAVIVATGALFVAAFWCAWTIARRRLPAWAAAVVVCLAAEVAVERFTVRPEAVTLCLLAVQLVLLDGVVGWGRVVALVAMQVAWANLHALSVLALVPLGIELGGALAAAWLPVPVGWRAASRRSPAEIRCLIVALVGTLLAEAVTPFGVTGAVYPLWLLTLIRGEDPLSFTIVEHRATTLAELSPAAGRSFVALLVLTATAAVAGVRRWRLQHVAYAGAFVVLAFMARRNVALLGLGVVPLVASGLQSGAAAVDAWLGRRTGWRPVLAVLLAGVLFWETARVVNGRYYRAARLTRAFGLGESRLLYSAAAVDFLEREAPTARVYNDDALGGWLEWRAYPPRQVFFDGRLQVFPRAVHEDYQRVLDDPAQFPDVAARWGITAVVLHHPAPGRLELAAAIARLPGWRIGFLDAGAVVLLADGRPPGAPVGAVGAAPAIDIGGVASALEHLLAPLRPAIEDAVTHYQRGRAILTLYGRNGVREARADFEAALRAWPEHPMAAQGLRATASLP